MIVAWSLSGLGWWRAVKEPVGWGDGVHSRMFCIRLLEAEYMFLTCGPFSGDVRPLWDVNALKARRTGDVGDVVFGTGGRVTVCCGHGYGKMTLPT